MKRRALAFIIGSVGFMWGATASGHPSLLFDSAGLQKLKERATDTTDTGLGWKFSDVIANVKKQADTFKNTPYSYTVDIPNPDGNGSVKWTYTLSESLPPPHPNNSNYPPWTAVSRQLQNRMETMALMYVLTEDSSYILNANKTGALDIAAIVSKWSQWTDPDYNCGLKSCLDTAHLTIGVSVVYDLVYGVMSGPDRQLLRNALIEKGIKSLAADIDNVIKTPGGIVRWLNGYALWVTGLAYGASSVHAEATTQAPAWLKLARDGTLAFYKGQGTDGGTLEGHLYGSYAMDNIVNAAFVLERKPDGEGIFDNSWVKRLPQFIISFLDSKNSSLANFGDSSAAIYWATTMFSLAARGDATAQWYLRTTRTSKPNGITNIILARPELAPEKPKGSGTALFQHVGYAALRGGFDGAPVVAVKSGPTSTNIGHNHFDHNSFIISANGEWIASDPGYREYFNVPRRIYTTGTVGHNTIMVDKSVSADGATCLGGQDKVIGGKLDFLFDGSAYAKVVANAENSYPNGLLSRFGRRVVYARPDVVFVFDDIAAPAAHEYSWLLHTAANGTIDKAGGPAEMVSVGNSAQMQTFIASSTPWREGYPKALTYPGADAFGPYGEWRSQQTQAVRFAAAMVPRAYAHTSFSDPGFEGILFQNWTPRYANDGTHAQDSSVKRSGNKSARIALSGSVTAGYYYSEPIVIAPKKRFKTSVYFKSSGATGTVGMQPYYMLNGKYIDAPAGESVTKDASSGTDWTHIELSSAAPSTNVDAVRIALQFSGKGTVWFDDASYTAIDSVDYTTPPSKADILRETQAGCGDSGVVVSSSSYGVEIGASTFGSGKAPPFVFDAVSNTIPEAKKIATDADVFALGKTTNNQFKRAYVQNGSYIDVNGDRLVKADKRASFDVRVDVTGSCVRVYATEVKTVEGPPYSVRVNANEVYLNGTRVAFTIKDAMTVFPDGSDVGKDCDSEDIPDASPPDGESDGAGGGANDDAAQKDSGAAGTERLDGGTGGSSADATDQADTQNDGGCDCALVASPRSSGWPIKVPISVLGAVLGLLTMKRRRRQGKNAMD